MGPPGVRRGDPKITPTGRTPGESDVTPRYDVDLFGEPVEPVEPRELKIPPRGTHAYWSYINSLTLPDGLKFLDLAPVPGLAGVPREERRFVEAVWCQSADSYDHLLLIDIRTGRRYER
jgi:hypothetical protein